MIAVISFKRWFLEIFQHRYGFITLVKVYTSREASSRLFMPMVEWLDAMAFIVPWCKRGMGESFAADAIVATTLGWDFSIPKGNLKMETQLQTLPGVLYLYTPKREFLDPRYAINIFCCSVCSRQSGSDEMCKNESIISIKFNVSAEAIRSSILSSNLYLRLLARYWSIMFFRFLMWHHNKSWIMHPSKNNVISMVFCIQSDNTK